MIIQTQAAESTTDLARHSHEAPQSKHMLFVAVVYNNFYDTRDFCDSLVKIHNRPPNSISCILIDNSDQTTISNRIDELKSNYGFVRVLRPTKNLGYFGAFNYLFQNLDVSDKSAVVLCNNDLLFDENFSEMFFAGIYPEDAHVICPNVITKDGIHQNPHVKNPSNLLLRLKLDLFFSNYYIGCFLKFLQALANRMPKRKSVSIVEKSGYLHMGIGACYILRPSFLRLHKSLIYPFFLYGEEAYLSRQVHSSGGRLYYDESLIVHHKESATLSKLPSRTTYEFAREGYWTYRSFY